MVRVPHGCGRMRTVAAPEVGEPTLRGTSPRGPEPAKMGPLEVLVSTAGRTDAKNEVIVGWDFSDAAERALAWAVEYAERFDARIVLVHVVLRAAATDVPLAPVDDAFLAQQAEAMREAAAAHGIEAEPLVLVAASISGALIDAATSRGASLLCMGHSRSGIARLVLGSVAEQVVQRSPVPVLVIRS